MTRPSQFDGDYTALLEPERARGAAAQGPRRTWHWLAGPLIDVAAFLLAPRDPLPGFNSRWQQLRFYTHLFVLALAVQVIWVVAVAGLRGDAGVVTRGFGKPTLSLFLAMVVFAPLYEELLFRSWLRHALYALMLAPFFAVRALFPFFSLLTALQFTSYAVVLSVYLFRKGDARAWIRAADGVLLRWRGWTVPVSTLVFAVAHAGNWDIPPGKLWLLPFIVLPQAVSGLMLAYARLRTGLHASILLHASINGLAFGLMWLAYRYG